MMPSFLSGIGSAISSPRGQGIVDLAGRAGNAMQGAGGVQQDPNSPSLYQPGQAGLAGIGYSASQVAGAPVKTGSNARFVPGGGRLPGLSGPNSPAQVLQPPALSPAMSPGGYPNGSGVPF